MACDEQTINKMCTCKTTKILFRIYIIEFSYYPERMFVEVQLYAVVVSPATNKAPSNSDGIGIRSDSHIVAHRIQRQANKHSNESSQNNVRVFVEQS